MQLKNRNTNIKKIHSISCDDALERMFAYIDESISGKSGEELDKYIETCRGCLKKLDFQLKLKKRLNKIKPVSASTKLTKRLYGILNS